MRRFIVGAGLVVMMSAVAFFVLVANDQEVPVSVVNTAAATSFWGFLGGTVLAVLGGIQRAGR